jgi:2-oxoglutarate ferredoxin oxidoreductase subunit alpha
MGMNQWMSKPFQYPDTPMDRGKVLFEKDLEELKGNWGRYLDKDGDGIAYRTFPGNKSPLSSYFTRGTGHDEYAKYSEDASIWLRNMDRLTRKYDTAREYVPAPVLHTTPGATIGIISFGSTEAAVLEAMHQLDTEHGIKADFLRIRAIPFTKEVTEFVNKYDQVFIVEMNRDGQMNQLLTIEYPQLAPKFRSVAYGDGMPASAKWVREGILAKYTAPVKTTEKHSKAATKTKVQKAATLARERSSIKMVTSKIAKKSSTGKISAKKK